MISIPAEIYATVYYNVLLLLVLTVYGQAFVQNLTSPKNIQSKNTQGLILIALMLLYIGYRPISFRFGDMGAYAIDFAQYKTGMPLRVERDILFEMFMKACSSIMSANNFFLLCCALYVMPLYFATKKLFKEYWFYGFFMLVVSFSFWAYGTNGIRNGIATSLFLLAISHKNKLWIAAWMAAAVAVHHSMIIPIVAYCITLFYRNPKVMMAGWALTIPLSLVLGSALENFVMGLGLVEEQRAMGYLSGSDEYLDKLVEVKTGFRWDFILYSATGVFAGWYFIIKRGFSDRTYDMLFSTFLIANAVWILVIRANFSNRIAYLSWFMLGLVIIYPLLKNEIFKQQHKVIGNIILIYFLFTYVLNVILD